MELWVASANRKKRKELERLLAPLGFALRSLAELPEPLDIVEDRPDFAGNAEVKATTLARHVGALALGDDSGLCVDALGGEPGVHSARWAGPGATDADRIDKLLHELERRHELAATTDRRARFVCHLCLAAPDGSVLARVEETCEGVIVDTPRGSDGFGYDPVFVPDAGDGDPGPAPTFAELSAAAKDAISHRGKALRSLARILRERLVDGDLPRRT
ncbi:MAG: non-canonical purine NTP pyrophosphatase [Planctomycetes bacterium]|nr:non-canonical purine NTP pyrophosphatase [Planctomycetota bacterium]